MKKFSGSFNGYNKDEVNAFVNDVTKKYEDMLNGLKERDQRLIQVTEKLSHYENMESTLNRALLVAEDASNQIKRIAREESNIILDDAKKNATRIINNALLKAEKAEADAENLQRRISVYRRRIKQALEAQVEMLDDMDNVEF